MRCVTAFFYVLLIEWLCCYFCLYNFSCETMSLKIDRVQLEIVIQQDQARQKMLELEDSMRKARMELAKIKKQSGENSEEYQKQQELIRRLKQEYDDLFDQIGLNNLSLKELGSRQKELNSILRNLNPNLPLYKQYEEQLNQVNRRIKELKGTATETRFSIAKLADGFNRYGAIAAGTIASLTGVALTARKCVDEFAEMKEAESQVTKYTGMTAEEVSSLNDEFKKMDTRTARTRLNELAGDAGRLGLQAKDEVLEFVEAANMINVSLGEDLGKDAITNIGKLADMFGDSSRSMKENMLAIGSAVNSVAQNSSAAEPYLVEFTARMGGVAKQANMSITDVMGFASALDQNMLRSEMASTALQGLILKIYQEPAKYAKLAGMDVKTFTDLINKDVNEAVLAFLSSLNRLGGMEKMAPVLDEMKLSGAEAAGVISALAGNVDKVRKEQEGANLAFTEGTSIVNEYNVQNSTVQAELEKAKKRFTEIRVELGEQLLPVMKYMITTGSLTIKGLSAIISVGSRYKNTIATLVVAITTYTIAVNASNLADKAKVFWTNKVIGTLRSLFTVMKTNPYTAAMALIAGVVALYRDWNNAGEKLTQTERNLRDIRSQGSREVAAEKKEVMDLLAVARDESQSKEHRLAAIRRLNEISPEYLGTLDLEKIKTEDATKAVDLYVQSLITKQNIENANRKKTDLLQQRDNLLQNGSHSGFFEDVWFNVKYSGADVLDRTMSLFNGYGDQWAKDVKEKLLNSTVDALRSLDQQLGDVDKFIEDERNKLLQVQIDVQKSKPLNHSEIGTEDMDAIFKQKQESLLKSMREEQNILKLQRQMGLLEEEEYQSGLYQIQIKYLSERKSLLDQYKQDSSEVEGQLLDAMIAESNRTYKPQEIRQIKSLPEPEEEAPDENTYDIDKYKQSLDGQLAVLNAFHEAGILSEQQYQDELTRILEEKEKEREQIRNAAMQTYNQVLSATSQLMQAMQDKETSKIERKYDKEIKAARKAGKDTTQLEEEKEEAVAGIKRKYADKQFALSVLQVTATTAVTAMEAYKSMAGIPFVGPALGAAAAAAAIAAGAAQIAIAQQQRDEAKGLKTGGYSQEYVEGYTSRGNPDDVAGVIPVHKNEFVTNHVGVANPHVRQFLDVFDVAQKNGTIGMINTTQILEQVRTRAGRYVGGYTEDVSAGSGQSASLHLGGSVDVSQLLIQIVTLLRSGNVSLEKIADKQLNVDVRAIRDGIRRVERLEANARR